MPVITPDQRCQQDGAYARCQRTGTLYRCLGQRLQDTGTRIGYEDVLDPSEVRWVNRGSVFTQRLRFITQGDPSSDREVIEAMR